MYSLYIYVQNIHNVQNIEGFFNLLKKSSLPGLPFFWNTMYQTGDTLSLSNFINSLRNPRIQGLTLCGYGRVVLLTEL